MALASRLKGLFIFAAGAVLALATAEAVARGYAFTPTAGATKTWHREGNATSHWRDGVRLPIAEAANRVLVLGDSYTAAQHVSDDETFAYRTDRWLRAHGVDAALLNAGVPGSNLADHVLDGPSLVKKHAAVWTVVVLTNDDLGPASWAKAGTHFVRGERGLSVKRPPERSSRLKDAMKPIRSNSALVQNAYLQYRGLLEMAEAWRPFHAEPRPRKRGKVAEFPVEAQLELAQQAFGGRVTFVHVGVGVDGRLEAQFREACVSARLSCVHTRASLEQLRQRGTPPQGFPNSGWDVGHLNAWGHAAVAEALGPVLRDALL